jgi:thiamine-monophosphate kinase
VAARGLDILFRQFTDADGAPIALTEAALAALPIADAEAVGRQLAPRPPIGAGAVVADRGASAMMDVSDGLVLDARRLADASGVTIDLLSARLGDDPARALRGGEDHALLATFPPGAEIVGDPIGVVRDRGADAVTVDGSPYDGDEGWDPYRDWDAGRG